LSTKEKDLIYRGYEVRWVKVIHDFSSTQPFSRDSGEFRTELRHILTVPHPQDLVLLLQKADMYAAT
jgi:hypothetical protein